MAITYEPIQTFTTSGSATTITFSSIPQTYTDLFLVLNGSVNGTNAIVALQMGNTSVDTGNNYSYNFLVGNGSTVTTSRTTTAGTPSKINLATITTSTNLLLQTVSISNYTNTSIYKTVLGRRSYAVGEVNAVVGLWKGTSAVNILTVLLDRPANLVSGFTATLYGIKAA